MVYEDFRKKYLVKFHMILPPPLVLLAQAHLLWLCFWYLVSFKGDWAQDHLVAQCWIQCPISLIRQNVAIVLYSTTCSSFSRSSSSIPGVSHGCVPFAICSCISFTNWTTVLTFSVRLFIWSSTSGKPDSVEFVKQERYWFVWHWSISVELMSSAIWQVETEASSVSTPIVVNDKMSQTDRPAFVEPIPVKQNQYDLVSCINDFLLLSEHFTQLITQCIETLEHIVSRTFIGVLASLENRSTDKTFHRTWMHIFSTHNW